MGGGVLVGYEGYSFDREGLPLDGLTLCPSDMMVDDVDTVEMGASAAS